MVMFETDAPASETQKLIVALKSKLKVKPEFKFNKTSDDYRDAFFEEIRECKFRTRAIVVRKELIKSAALKTVKESFYKFFVRQMMQHDSGTLEFAKVVIDGSGDRTFKREFRSYIRKNIGSDQIASLELKDSHRDPLIQLADMTAGAIARSYRDDRKEPNRWRAMLAKHRQLEDVWEFR